MGRLTTLTPAMAQELLDRGGPQRPLRKNRVAAYEYDMTHDRWRDEQAQDITTSAIPPHPLTNGTHRATALARAKNGTTIKVRMSTAEFVDIQDTNRSIADILSAGGYDGRTLGAGFVTSIRWSGSSRRANDMSPIRRVEWILGRKNVLDAAELSAAGALRTAKKTLVPRLPLGVVGALYDIATASPEGAGTSAVTEFVDELTATGSDDATLQALLGIDIRRRSNQRSGAMHTHSYGQAVARAFAGWLDNEQLGVLRSDARGLTRVPGFAEWMAQWKEIV